MTSHVFQQLLQRLLSGEPFVEARHPGCLRPQLLGNARTTAITRWHRERDTLSPDFHAWVAAGGRWPWGEDGQLALAFQRLPATTQCLLWHSMVERDDPALTARIAGLAPDAAPAACELAASALKQARTDLYLERLGRPGCKDAAKWLTSRPETPPAEETADHLRSCPACMSLYKDVTRLDKQLAAQLPVRLLGWWTGQHYLHAKAATPQPLGDTPLLATSPGRARAAAPAARSYTRRATATTTPRHRGKATAASLRRTRVPRPTRASVAVVGFLIGLGVAILTLIHLRPAGSASARFTASIPTLTSADRGR
ncbi:hypothetical protein [Streptomyces coffeae]|uniref:Zinc-finger domain-containing protein n=1 Tax=Streptomyces coffeae TaxID=621382 RepID=A0ABS1NQE8_9ACTN|nr:hypothetical protein [Streptomyces coffeae]MBL1102127.1 hypothetical protein [Streptomyces coffeae]